MLTDLERKVIEESVLKRLREKYPGAKGGRILSRIEGYVGHVHEGKVKIVYAPGIYKIRRGWRGSLLLIKLKGSTAPTEALNTSP